MNSVYLDYLSTTPLDAQVAAAMAECLTLDGTFGNPASRSHRYGWEAEMAVETARQQLAALIGADVREIVFTSGATEADNLAIKGVAEAALRAGSGFESGFESGSEHSPELDLKSSPELDRKSSPEHASEERPVHIVTAATEHKAVLDSCRALQRRGVSVTYVPPDGQGLIPPRAVAAALRPETCLVSVMHANNEIGTINDVAAIAEVAHAGGVPLHVDAAQSVGKIPVDVGALDVDLLSISAHKFYGPKGVGALYRRRRNPVQLEAQIHGGGHERGLRSGTLATHQIVGMGKAAQLAMATLADESQRLCGLRRRLLAAIADMPGIRLNGHAQRRLPGALNISVADVDGEALLLSLPEFALSTGSACTSASLEPSHVLRALGLPDALAHSSLRISLGRFSTAAEVDWFSERLREVVSRLRGGSA